MEKEILHTADSFNTIKKDGLCGFEPNKLSIVIMPYVSVNGLPFSIGVIDEINPFREGGRSKTLITCSSMDEDPDLLMTAHRKLKETAGIDVLDPDRWTFLGFMTTDKCSASSYPCFACDVTGLIPEIVTSDNESKFVVIPVKDALDVDDCFIPTLFMKMFRYIFNFSNGQPGDEAKPKNTSKQELTQDIKDKVLAIDGINGVATDSPDGKFEVFTKSELSDKAKAQLDSIFKEIGSEYKLQLINTITQNK